MKPALYLVPASLGGEPKTCVTEQVRCVLRTVKHVIAEDTKCAKRFIHAVLPDADVDALDYYELNEHTKAASATDCLDPLDKNEAIALMSDAGSPSVADPGAAAVALAHKKRYPVVPLAGASSIIMALMASGLNGQSFAFNGYLPVKASERAKRLRALENRARQEGQTQIFIETPYRADAMLETALHTLRDDTKLSISAELTTENEICRTMTVKEWRSISTPTQYPHAHSKDDGSIHGGDAAVLTNQIRHPPVKIGKVRAVFLIAK